MKAHVIGAALGAVLGYVPPDEFERAYYNRQAADAELATLT